MKTLYISDLDGTLLNDQAELSPQSAHLLNRLTARGMHFSVATARTSATVVQMLTDISLSVPAILMNGVCIYDLSANRPVHVNYIPHPSALQVIECIHRCHAEGFLYTMHETGLSTWYERCSTPHARQFMEERQQKYGKPFTPIADFSALAGQMIYYSLSDTEEKLAPLYQALRDIPGIRCEFYRDIYQTDHWYLEICSECASKFNALRYLQKEYGFDRTVGFGDNLNDLPLFAACDLRIAVSNAHENVRRQADILIGSNREDSVARWLTDHYDKETIR